MTNYRRNFVTRGTFFFTVNLAARRLRLLTENIDLLRHAFRKTRVRHPFTTATSKRSPDGAKGTSGNLTAGNRIPHFADFTLGRTEGATGGSMRATA